MCWKASHRRTSGDGPQIAPGRVSRCRRRPVWGPGGSGEHLRFPPPPEWDRSFSGLHGEPESSGRGRLSEPQSLQLPGLTVSLQLHKSPRPPSAPSGLQTPTLGLQPSAPADSPQPCEGLTHQQAPEPGPQAHGGQPSGPPGRQGSPSSLCQQTSVDVSPSAGTGTQSPPKAVARGSQPRVGSGSSVGPGSSSPDQAPAGSRAGSETGRGGLPVARSQRGQETQRELVGEADCPPRAEP